MKVKVKTPSRLHFGFIDLNGSLGRIDGSVGLALAEPNVVVEAEKAGKLNVVNAGERSRELSEIVGKVAEFYGTGNKVKIRLIEEIPPHVGLGGTTQLYLATAKAVAEVAGIRPSVRELAWVVGRGGTSGIGVGAFEQGGFLVDGGHTFGSGGEKKSFTPSGYSQARPSPIISRLRFPDWTIMLFIPEERRGLHGKDELKYFKEKFPAPEEEAERISRIVLMKLLPAVAEKNLDGLDNAMKLFNKARSFKPDEETAELIKDVESAGGRGVSVSSFGPTVFAFADEKKVAGGMIKRFDESYSGVTVITKARNRGAEVKEIP